MGLCFGNNSQQEQQNAPLQRAEPPKPKIQEVDVVKSKLKLVRDKIQTVVSRKEQQRDEISREIRVKYERSKNKKELLPLLSTKKEIETFISNTDTRLTVINRTLRDIEMQQIDANMVNVLDESNKFMAKVQQQLQDKNWRQVVEDAKQKYEGVDWNMGEEEDEQFKTLWKELGGEKLDKQQQQPQPVINGGVPVRVVEVPRVPSQNQQNQQVHYA